LAEADATVVAAQRAAAGERGTLHIGYSWSARFQTLPALGQAFKGSRPEVELLAEEMWNGRMPDALRAGAIDVAVSLCPDVMGELAYELVRSEPVIALLAADHELATEEGITLTALADEELMLFPRELAPKLHDFLVGLCRSAGFEPKQNGESFHTRWTIGTWEPHTFALVPASAAGELPSGVAAVAIDEPDDRLETHVVWRTADESPTVAAFVAQAGAVFANQAT
jgi:DNA-binding transcriptional LysR family regulator